VNTRSSEPVTLGTLIDRPEPVIGSLPMSYDLNVYAERELSADGLRSLVESAGFHCENEPASFIVTRGAKRGYCFTLSLPAAVEAEDVPEEVTAVLLTPAFLYELLVEGSSQAEIPHAVKFARRLAAASSGTVLDQQTGETWTRGKLRTPPKIEHGTVDVVEVRWYVPSNFDSAEAARSWLRLARAHLPEALPRRYGQYEPLPMKFDVKDPEPFVQLAADSGGLLFFKASSPATDGHLAGTPNAGANVAAHSLTLHREALHDARWREALRAFFVQFAIESRAVLATAEVVRGLTWSGRSLSFGPGAEKTTYLAPRGQWLGLPPYPVWWVWFGAEYVELVTAHFDVTSIERIAGGLFHERSIEPNDRDQLLSSSVPSSPSMTTMQRLLRRKPAVVERKTWLPADLLPVVDDSDQRVYNPPATPAVVRPPSLG
jgi:hypothetical protein